MTVIMKSRGFFLRIRFKPLKKERAGGRLIGVTLSILSWKPKISFKKAYGDYVGIVKAPLCAGLFATLSRM